MNEHEWKLLERSGGLWEVASVEARPELILSSWAVFEVNRPGRPRARHFAGYNEADREGRTSSAIIQFDEASGRGVTSSGRVYQLIGPPGLGLDAEYVWRSWMRINEASDVADVTEAVRQQMSCAKAKMERGGVASR